MLRTATTEAACAVAASTTRMRASAHTLQLSNNTLTLVTLYSTALPPRLGPYDALLTLKQ